MGEAKRRKKIDPTFGIIPRSLPGRDPDLGLYLNTPDIDHSSFVFGAYLVAPRFMYSFSEKMLCIKASTYFDKLDFSVVFELLGISESLAVEIAGLALVNITGSFYAARNRQSYDKQNQRVIPLVPIQNEELQFFSQQKTDFWVIRGGSLVPNPFQGSEDDEDGQPIWAWEVDDD